MESKLKILSNNTNNINPINITNNNQNTKINTNINTNNEQSNDTNNIIQKKNVVDINLMKLVEKELDKEKKLNMKIDFKNIYKSVMMCV